MNGTNTDDPGDFEIIGRLASLYYFEVTKAGIAKVSFLNFR
jgi:hypothetical protein